MAVITYTDVATAIGRPITDYEQEQVTQWISDVEMLIGARLGDLTELDQPLLEYVVREAVIARMRWKDTRNSDGGATGDNVDTGEENYFLRILNPWWALLAPAGNTGSGAFSVRPYFEPDDVLVPESWV